MATIQFPRKGVARLATGPIASARVIEVIVNLATDVVMTTATDDIVVADLPKGSIVVAAGVEQITAGTGTGTLVARVGTNVMSATLASTAAAGTVTAVGTVIPQILTADATLNLLGATATRLDGKVRVFALVVEGLSPTVPAVAARDTSI